MNKVRILDRARDLFHAVSFRNLENVVLAHVFKHSIQIAFAFVVVAIFVWAQPYGLFELWSTTGSINEWLFACWPIFAWAFGVTAWQCASTYNDPVDNRHAEHILRGGFLISTAAGVFEEMLHRWIGFMFCILTVQLANFIFFGFLGFGIPEFFFNFAVGPIANFFTLGYLESYLTNPEIWMVGAGLIASNSAFRDGHKYQGFWGWVNSWFLGMVFFYMTLTYGLVAAITVHFLYDLVIFLVVYIDMVIERAMGRR